MIGTPSLPSFKLDWRFVECFNCYLAEDSSVLDEASQTYFGLFIGTLKSIKEQVQFILTVISTILCYSKQVSFLNQYNFFCLVEKMQSQFAPRHQAPILNPKVYYMILFSYFYAEQNWKRTQKANILMQRWSLWLFQI